MQPKLVIFNISSLELDTVIVWDDGRRDIAYAYKAGRVTRTIPLESDDPVGEIRSAFRITDGQIVHLGAIRPAAVPQPPAPPRARW